MAPYTPPSSQLGGSMYMGAPAYIQQGGYMVQYGYPYQSFGYPCSPELMYQQGMYNPYGVPHYPQMYSGPTAMASAATYPYVQFMPPTSQGFSMQLPQATQYGAGATITSLPQHSYALLPLPSPVASAGPTLGYSSASTVASPGLSSPPQLYPVQPQPFSHVPKGEHPSY
eukprot:c6923_g1_i2 orf=66-575(-)